MTQSFILRSKFPFVLNRRPTASFLRLRARVRARVCVCVCVYVSICRSAVRRQRVESYIVLNHQSQNSYTL